MKSIRCHFCYFPGATLAALCMSFFVTVSAYAMPYTGLVVFGDSLSDTGNNAIFFDTFGGAFTPPVPPGSRTPTPIPSQAFIPTLPYASNRYSNGPVWVDYFAASLGLPLAPSLAGGNNYAFGGARTGPAGAGFPFNLLDQTSQFLTKTGGVAAASNLYVVAGGGNDARDAFQTAAVGGNPALLISQFVANTTTIIARLLAAGAHDLLLVNIPDIGKTPAIRSLGAPASALASSLAATMNNALDAALAALLTPPNTHIFELNAFALVDNMVANPATFGLTDVTSACAAIAACIAAPNTTLFWDGIHPTTAADKIIAQAALRAIPEPATLLLLAFGVALLTVRRRNKNIV